MNKNSETNDTKILYQEWVPVSLFVSISVSLFIVLLIATVITTAILQSQDMLIKIIL